MDATFKALSEAVNPPEVDSSVTPDATPSALDLNAIVARLDDIAARLDKIESAEKQEPWHTGYNDDYAKQGSGYSDDEIDGDTKAPPAEESEVKDK